MNPNDKYEARAQTAGSLLCVGLDPDIRKIPERFKNDPHPQFAFNKWIIDETHEHVAAFKPNIAFYEEAGEEGMESLMLTAQYLREHHPDIFTIVDIKRGDIGNTNEAYARTYYDVFGFDAVTMHPYLGREPLNYFLERKDKACIILCRTSNPGAGEIQDLQVDAKPLWQVVAERVRDDWNYNNNCMLVIGAPYPQELAKARELMGEMTFLVPGVGSQGGDTKAVIEAGKNSNGMGLIVNSSRGVIYADDPREAARALKEEINQYR